MRRGFTIIELMVSLAVIGILLALLLPAVQMAREAARKTQCRSNLHNIGIALHSYHSTHSSFPAGMNRGLSLHVMILPYVDRADLYQLASLDSQPSAFSNNLKLAATRILLYACPSDPFGTTPLRHGGYPTSYVGNHGAWCGYKNADGVFRISGYIRMADITDGLSNTAAVSEHLISNFEQERDRVLWQWEPRTSDRSQFSEGCRSMSVFQPATNHNVGGCAGPWIDGNLGIAAYNHVLSPGQNSCTNDGNYEYAAFTARSKHANCVNVLYADGHVSTANSSVDNRLWGTAGTRNGNDHQGGDCL